MTERDWRVSVGFYADHEVWRGSSAFLAGLWLARAARGRHQLESVTIYDRETLDGEYDDEGRAHTKDDRTDEEAEFFSACELSGECARDRRLARLRAKKAEAAE